MGLIVYVYRAPELGCDCTNNGISRRFDQLCLVDVPGPFDPDEKRPAAILKRHPTVQGHCFIVPATNDGNELPGHFMMGGNYAACSDSRFHRAVKEMTGNTGSFAVSIHDRQE